MGGEREVCKYSSRKRRRWPARLLLGPVLEHKGCERRRSAHERHNLTAAASFFAEGRGVQQHSRAEGAARLLKLQCSRRQAARPLACEPSTCDTEGDAC